MTLLDIAIAAGGLAALYLVAWAILWVICWVFDRLAPPEGRS